MSHVFWPSVGGAELNHLMVAKELKRHAEVVVFTASLTTSRPTEEANPAEGIRVERLPSLRFFGENLILPWTLVRRLRAYEPDVVWTNHPSLTADLAAIFALLFHYPWVATYHADLSERRFYAAVYTWWVSRLLRFAHRVLVNTNEAADLLASRGIRREHIATVHPGPGIGFGIPPEVPVTWVDSESPGPNHPVLFVGGLDRAREYKRPEWVLRAIAELASLGTSVYVEFVGDGDRRERLVEMSRMLGVDRLTHFAGHLDDQQLARQYARAWALVLPSTRTEGFGLVAIEAAYYGCPVIASSVVPAGALLAKDGGALEFDALSLDSFRDQLFQLWTDRALRRKLSEAIAISSTRFRWDLAAPQIAREVVGAIQRCGT